MAPIEIVFLDVETTIPFKKGQKFELLEFAAVVIASEGFYETSFFSTLIKPPDLASITPKSVACNGITQVDCVDAPAFLDVADKIFDVLHGRVWAGHNIARFDILKVREAFERCKRPAPEPLGVIDTLPLLRSKFGKRAGNLKMARLAEYCGLGDQQHRALEDCRLNIEVLKHCAAMLFLESNFSDVFSPPPLAPAAVIQADSLASPPEREAPPATHACRTDRMRPPLVAPCTDQHLQNGEASGSSTSIKKATGQNLLTEEPSTESLLSLPFAALSLANGARGLIPEWLRDELSEEVTARETSHSDVQRAPSFEEGFPQAPEVPSYGNHAASAEGAGLSQSDSQKGGSGHHWQGPLEEERLRFSGYDERDKRVATWLNQEAPDASPWREPSQDCPDASPSSDAFRSLESPDQLSGGTLRQGMQTPGGTLSGSGSAGHSRTSIHTRHLEVFRIALEQGLPDGESSDNHGESDLEGVNQASYDPAQSPEREPISTLQRVQSEPFDESLFSFPITPGIRRLPDWPATPEPLQKSASSCFPGLKKYAKRRAGKAKASERQNSDDADTRRSSTESGSRSRSDALNESPANVETRNDAGPVEHEGNGGLSTTHNPIFLHPLYTEPAWVNEPHVSPPQSMHGDPCFGGAKPQANGSPLDNHLWHSYDPSQGLEDPLPKSHETGGSLQALYPPPQQLPADVLEGPYSNDVTSQAAILEHKIARSRRRKSPDLVPAFAPWEVDVSSLEYLEVVRSRGSPQLTLSVGGQPLQIREQQMRLRFSVGDLYAYDATGRPTFSVLGEPSDELTALMDGCDALLRAELEARGVRGEWRPSSIRKDGEADALRIRIGAVGFHQTAHFTTQFLRRKRGNRGAERLPLGVVDPLIFRSFFPHGCMVDIVFSIESYSVEGFAGTRLVASQLTLL